MPFGTEDFQQLLQVLDERPEWRAEITRKIRALTDHMATLTDQVGDLRGWRLEQQYIQRAPSYFGSIVRRLRVLSSTQLADRLDDAVDEGKLTGAERAAVLQADLVVQGRRREDQADVYLVVEVSAGIGLHHVERAALRAQILGKLGRPAIPIVAGHRIDPEVEGSARQQGVLPVVDGSLLN